VLEQNQSNCVPWRSLSQVAVLSTPATKTYKRGPGPEGRVNLNSVLPGYIDSGSAPKPAAPQLHTVVWMRRPRLGDQGLTRWSW
jgi:hypothetical protein